MTALRKEDVDTKEGYTVEDIYALPEGERAELINGQIYYMAPPTARHQRLLSFLNTEINLYIRRKGGECEVFPSPRSRFSCTRTTGIM